MPACPRHPPERDAQGGSMAPVPGGRRSGRRRRRRRCRPTGPGTWSGPCAGRRPGGPGGAGWRRKGRGPWLGRGGGASIGFFFPSVGGGSNAPVQTKGGGALLRWGEAGRPRGCRHTQEMRRAMFVRACVRARAACTRPAAPPTGGLEKAKNGASEPGRKSTLSSHLLEHTHTSHPAPPHPAPPPSPLSLSVQNTTMGACLSAPATG